MDTRPDEERRSPVEYWSIEEGCESLSITDPDEAMGEYLADLPRDAWPETLDVMCYVRDAAFFGDHSQVIDWIHDALDETYSGPDSETGSCDSRDATPEIESLAKKLCDAICKQYVPWTCSRVPERDITVNVMDWVRENESGWLEENP